MPASQQAGLSVRFLADIGQLLGQFLGAVDDQVAPFLKFTQSHLPCVEGAFEVAPGYPGRFQPFWFAQNSFSLPT